MNFLDTYFKKLKMTNFTDLCDDIVRMISEYEDLDELFEEKEFSQYKYTVGKLKLNKKDSLKYYNGELDVSDKIKYPKKQLCLDFSGLALYGLESKPIVAYSVNLSDLCAT